jgi:transcriptional regulator with AAA-type ATPase domain
VVAFVSRVGPSDATVPLGGESGSGKEMVARAILVVKHSVLDDQLPPEPDHVHGDASTCTGW